MKFLNEIDGASKIITDPFNQFVTQAEKTKIGQIDNKADKSQVLTNVPANAVFTDTTYGVATTSANGLMSGTDKTNLNSNTSARHSHTNKMTLDKITEVDGELRYNGETVVTKTVFTWAKLKGQMSWGELIGL